MGLLDWVWGLGTLGLMGKIRAHMMIQKNMWLCGFRDLGFRGFGFRGFGFRGFGFRGFGFRG